MASSSTALYDRSIPPTKLWSPLNGGQDTATFRFLRQVNSQHKSSLQTYADLWKWSTSPENTSQFWDDVWDFTQVLGSKGKRGASVSGNSSPSDNPSWYPDASINWAENMLRRRDAKVALVQASEPTPEDPNPPYRKMTYGELYDLTARVVGALRAEGVQPGDRIGSYASNCIENVAASLAAAAIGAIWASVSADFGVDAALSRFEQVQPKVLFSVDETTYNAKVHAHLPKLDALVSQLQQKGLEPRVVVIPARQDKLCEHSYMSWGAFLPSTPTEIDFRRGSFDHPLWILFSSGTTNKPKPIVHRAGGMLLQSKKEFVIAADLTDEDVFFYYTTTGWMMWQFLVNALSVGCTIVLYDGSPLKDPGLLWRMSEELGVTIFGTSAKYIDQLAKDSYHPKERHDLRTIRQIYSTGSPLAPHLFDYVYEHISKDVMLASISGGTDICSLFAGMCSALPVYRGELQCRMLGMAIESFSSDGQLSEEGELVCTRPFPCQPLGFWPLDGPGSDEASERYRQSYFSEFDRRVWYHGDHVLITPSRDGNGGGVVMLGRSDGVLNPGGIRFGSSEIYDVIESSSLPILDSLAVGQTIAGGDERVILFLKLKPGEPPIETKSIKEVKTLIRLRRTARHVPEVVVQVQDIPYTLNGKKVEVPIKKILNGTPLTSLNLSTLRNPDCLEEYVRLASQDLRIVYPTP